MKAGDFLAEIDPRPFEVQLAQARGQIARDHAQLRNAWQDLERYRALYAQDSIEEQKLDGQKSLVHQYAGAVMVDQSQTDNATASIASRAALWFMARRFNRPMKAHRACAT